MKKQLTVMVLHYHTQMKMNQQLNPMDSHRNDIVHKCYPIPKQASNKHTEKKIYQSIIPNGEHKNEPFLSQTL